MTSEDVKRLEAIQSTVVTDGWKYIIEDVETKVKQLKDELINPQVGLDLLRLAQGRIVVYNELLTLGVMVDQALEMNKEDNEQASDI